MIEVYLIVLCCVLVIYCFIISYLKFRFIYNNKYCVIIFVGWKFRRGLVGRFWFMVFY